MRLLDVKLSCKKKKAKCKYLPRLAVIKVQAKLKNLKNIVLFKARITGSELKPSSTTDNLRSTHTPMAKFLPQTKVC